MTRLKLGIGGGLVLALAILWAVQHQAGVKLREENNSLQQKIERLALLETENERLSNLLAHANSSLADEQLKDLLRLRSEVGSLRRQTNELQKLREQNQQLRAGLKAGNNSQATNSPPEVPPQDIHPKESWTFAGYATPEAAVESMAWAVNNGDAKTFMASLTPEMQNDFFKGFAGTETEFIDEGKKELSKFTGFRILQRDVHSDNEVVLDVFMDGDDHSDKLLLKKIDGQWKFAGPAEN